MRLFLLFSALLLSLPGFAGEPGSWPIDRLKTDVPTFRIEDRGAKIQSILYEGEAIKGQPTEVFAFYASPATLGEPRDENEKYPGIVLVHGGGGTAFAEWVHLWAKRGYAAIAMDLSGSRPPAAVVDDKGQLKAPIKPRQRLERGGVNHGRAEKFGSIGGTIEDDWPYHAVAIVMRAHTLLRSFAEVDADKTAVTGISWGGYTTCLVASLDDRFRCAVPVYGCGFLHEGESVQKPAIDALGDRRMAWVTAYDPGSHLGKCTIPTFWVNGTHDKHYVLDSYAKSYRQVRGPTTFRIGLKMPHGHAAGWRPAEIGIYVDSILGRGEPLPVVGPLVTQEGTVSAIVTSKIPITKAELQFTRDEGVRSERKWQTLPARFEDGKVIAKNLPKEANTWLLAITDERGALVTTEIGFR